MIRNIFNNFNLNLGNRKFWTINTISSSIVVNESLVENEILRKINGGQIEWKIGMADWLLSKDVSTELLWTINILLRWIIGILWMILIIVLVVGVSIIMLTTLWPNKYIKNTIIFCSIKLQLGYKIWNV